MGPDAWFRADKNFNMHLVKPGSPSFAEDEAAVRRVLREAPMRGAISLAFTREPYFFAPSADPSVCYPFVIRHRNNNETMACCALSLMPVYWGGRPATAAYLHLLRVLPAFRGIAPLRFGYAALGAFRERVCPQGPCFTSIVADNSVARRLLEAGLKGLPRYTPLGGLTTLALAAARPGGGQGLLRPAEQADIPELAAFYAARHSPHDLAPRLEEAWFRSLGTPARPDLRIEDFLVYRQGGKPAGAIALWDQRATRQTVIAGYSKVPALARPVYNAWAKLAGRPPLPARGQTIRAMYLAFAAFAPEAQEAAPACLQEALGQVKKRGCDTALMGQPQDAPLATPGFKTIRCDSVIYSVHWPGESCAEAPRERPCPEVSLL